MTIFASDVDGVAADMVGGFSRWVEYKFGVMIDPQKVVFHDRMGRSPDLYDANEALAEIFPGRGFDGDGRGIGGAFECFMKDRDVYGKYISPMPGAVEAIAAIRKNHQVVFVTALMRSARDHFRSKMEWIERWFPGLQIVTCPSGLKQQFRCDFATDDRYDTCARWSLAGASAMLFDQPWSEVPAGVHVERWDWKRIQGRLG